MKKLKAKIKYLKSFFKSDWNFHDYPLETWKNVNAQQEDLAYGATFTNWLGFIAHGETENQAVANLKQHLIDFKKNNADIPRPGAYAPLEFSETDKIEEYEEIAVDFFDKIIEINFYECFVSDLSSLHDFGLADEATLKKIELEYEITPKDKDYFLSDIFEQIQEKANG